MPHGGAVARTRIVQARNAVTLQVLPRIINVTRLVEAVGHAIVLRRVWVIRVLDENGGVGKVPVSRAHVVGVRVIAPAHIGQLKHFLAPRQVRLDRRRSRPTFAVDGDVTHRRAQAAQALDVLLQPLEVVLAKGDNDVHLLDGRARCANGGRARPLVVLAYVARQRRLGLQARDR